MGILIRKLLIASYGLFNSINLKQSSEKQVYIRANCSNVTTLLFGSHCDKLCLRFVAQKQRLLISLN